MRWLPITAACAVPVLVMLATGCGAKSGLSRDGSPESAVDADAPPVDPPDAAPGDADEDEPAPPDAAVPPALPEPWGTPGQWWLLSHPNYDSPGLRLVDTTTGELLKTLPLPATAESPHALAAEAERLWVADYVSEKIYRIRTGDGAVEDTLTGYRTGGLALTRSGFWYNEEDWSGAEPGTVFHHRRFDGGIDLSLRVGATTMAVADLAYDGRFLYYSYNDANDPIVRVDLATSAQDTLVPHTVIAVSTLAFDGEALVIDSGWGTLLRYDPDSGERLDEVDHGVGGWITAISPAWGE
jgi:hypothetical protein